MTDDAPPSDAPETEPEDDPDASGEPAAPDESRDEPEESAVPDATDAPTDGQPDSDSAPNDAVDAGRAVDVGKAVNRLEAVESTEQGVGQVEAGTDPGETGGGTDLGETEVNADAADSEVGADAAEDVDVTADAPAEAGADAEGDSDVEGDVDVEVDADEATDVDTDEAPDAPDAGPDADLPPDVRKYDRFKKMNGAQYERVNQFLRDRTYITAREWALARLCSDFRTETGVEMTKIGENLPVLVPFMTDTYTPQAVNQARSAFEQKVRKAGATFLYGAMCDFFTADELDEVMYEATEVAKFLLEVEGIDLAVADELEAEERISSVMREVRRSSDELRHEGTVCPSCGHEFAAHD